MNQTDPVNRRFVLAKRPAQVLTPDIFRLESVPLPEPAEGQLLLRTLYLSIDPYMRGRIQEGPSYAEPVAIGGVMVGETVSRVERSGSPGFSAGDLVLSPSGWQEYAALDAGLVRKLDPAMECPTHALGVLGMPGLTAYYGLAEIGRPKAGETVVVAAASGAVGSVVGQMAKLAGARAVGIAGGQEKCDYVTGELGFDACVNHYGNDLPQQLAAACPQGIDVYFENVGGAVLQAVLPLLNVGARIPLCGAVAHYNGVRSDDFGPALLLTLLRRRVHLQGFIVLDHYESHYERFLAEMGTWVNEGKVKTREDVLEGLKSAPMALVGVLRGDNFGKLLVKVAD